MEVILQIRFEILSNQMQTVLKVNYPVKFTEHKETFKADNIFNILTITGLLSYVFLIHVQIRNRYHFLKIKISNPILKMG